MCQSRSLRNSVVALVAFCVATLSLPVIASIHDGSSQELAATSGSAILANDPGSSDGTYWIDPNGGTTDDAFIAYVDMTTSGGGWTLGSLSFDATYNLSSTVGTALLSTAHSRKLLPDGNAILEADIRHVLWRDTPNPSPIVLTSAGFTSKTDLISFIDSNIASAPPSPQYSVVRQEIWVRGELFQPEAFQDATVPEPSTYIVFTGLILCFGLASWWRKRRLLNAA